jgi:tripartite-type tricarboxylate transporter receptor subunit TctC
MWSRVFVGALLLAAGSNVYAEEFPVRTVTIVSPYQAGGTSDIIARILAQKLSERWGKSVIVENRPGANGGIGVSAVARATADGHTLLAVASSALTINPLFYPKLPYNVDADLAPITRTGVVANVLVVHPSVPARNVQELIALAKAKPGTLSYASQGNGSNGHVTGELFKQRAGIDILHIPYKGSAPAVQDLLAGQVQLMFDNLPSVLQLIRSGQLRALAVTTAERDSQLPDTPAIAESGLLGFDTSGCRAGKRGAGRHGDARYGRRSGQLRRRDKTRRLLPAFAGRLVERLCLEVLRRGAIEQGAVAGAQEERRLDRQYRRPRRAHAVRRFHHWRIG